MFGLLHPDKKDVGPPLSHKSTLSCPIPTLAWQKISQLTRIFWAKPFLEKTVVSFMMWLCLAQIKCYQMETQS